MVLIHDSTADDDRLRDDNATLDLVRVLVPTLLADGARLVPLTDVVHGASTSS